ncbi:MAG: hypothetical protein QMD53_00460 [Actinomycetota bacterium]|nr:hypothetical protein [Actinomycetota bacterium]
MTVKPTEVNLSAPPGSAISGELLLIGGEKERNLSMTVQDIVIDDGSVTYKRLDEDDPSSVATWIELDKTAIKIKPGQSKRLSYQMEVPYGSKAGDHKVVVFISDDTAAKGSQGLNIVGRVGVTFNINVLPLVKDEVSKLDVVGEWYGCPKFIIVLKNQGSVESSPSGRLTIIKEGGRAAAVNEAFRSQAIAPGEEASVTIGDVKGLSGRYIIKVSLDTLSADTAETHFFAPSRLIIILMIASTLGLLVSLYLLARLLAKR